MTREDQRKIAEKRAEKQIGFFVHLIVYIGVNTILAIINLTTNHDSLWFLWPLAGWGVGLLLHGLGVFVLRKQNLAIRDWLIRREVESQRRNAGQTH